MDTVCRICYDQANKNNPLLNPCECKGSIEFIHKKCLIKWMRMSSSQECELCKTSYDLEVFVIEKIYEPSSFVLYISTYPHFFYVYISSIYIAYLLYDNTNQVIHGNRNVGMNMLLAIGFKILPYMLILFAAIQASLLIPAIYVIKQKYRYLQYALSCNKISNMRVYPLTYFSMIAMSISMCFYFTVAGPLLLLFLTSQLYGVHTRIVLQINDDSMNLLDE